MPSPFPLRTLRGYLTLLASVVTLPAFLFVVYIASTERTAALARVESEARYAAEVASREHASQILGAERLLERLAAIGARDEAAMRAMLPPILAGFPQVANLGLLDREGRLVDSVVPPPRPVDMSGNAAFSRALRTPGVAVGRYQLGEIVGRPVLILAIAIRQPDGEVRLVLFAALELSWLGELARQADVPADTVLMIADTDGTVLASSAAAPGPAWRLRPFDELCAAVTGMVRIEGAGEEGRLAVASPLRGAEGLRVVVGTDEERVRVLVNRVFYRDLAVLALFAMFAVAASIVAADVSVLRDLRLLARATRRFGSGDLASRSPVPRAQGEIRDVTTAFNAMAASLELREREATESRETLRALTHRLEIAREEEARRIAHELHDELGQELTVLKLELENVRRRLGDDEIRTGLDAMGEAIDESIRSVRRIASELRPGVLDRLGLTAAVEWLARDFEKRASIRTTLRLEDPQTPVDAAVATALFRIIQEALTNVARHARASAIVVELHEEEEAIVLRIGDDGRGFDTAAAGRTSLGLAGMRERVRRFGGSLEIVSAEGRGTELTASVPHRRMEEWSCAS